MLRLRGEPCQQQSKERDEFHEGLQSSQDDQCFGLTLRSSVSVYEQPQPPGRTAIPKAKLFLHVDRAALHHKHRALEQGYVLEGVAVHGNNIGELALVYCPDPVRPAEQICGVYRSGLDCLDGSHSLLNVNGELMSIEPVRINSGISPESHLHSRLKSVPQVLAACRSDRLHLLGVHCR